MRTFSLSHSEVIQDGEGKLEGGSPEKREKNYTCSLGYCSSPVFWKTRMKDGGLRIEDEGKRIRDQRSPFHRQKKFPPQLEIQSLIQRCGEKTKKHCS